MPKVVKSPTSTPAKDPAKTPSQTAESKRAAQAKQDAELTAQVVKRFVKGDETAATVAKDLNVSPVKVLVLAGIHRVAVGEVPAIEGKTDASLLKAIAAARNKADEFSSWGWLAVRSGKSEAWIKGELEKAGLYEKKAVNIAQARAAARPAAPKAPAAAGTTGGKKRVRGNA